MKNKNTKIKYIFYHVTVWVIYELQFTIFYPKEYIDEYGFLNILFKQFSAAFFDLIPFYINYLYLTEKLLFNNKFIKFFSINIFLLAFAYLLDIIHALILDLYFNSGDFFLNDRRVYYFNYTLFNLLFIVLGTATRIFVNWYKTNKQKEQLNLMKVEAELSYLKYQINPHFIFNTLNNIYSLAVNKSEKTAEMILHLTKHLRYVLDSDTSEYELSNEIELINSFINLQKIRLINPDCVILNIEVDHNFKLESAILLPFIENTFKHGIINDIEKPININIKTESNCLFFKTANFKNNKKQLIESGIGLSNVKRRLEIVYGKNSDLEIFENDKIFVVKLEIKFDESA